MYYQLFTLHYITELWHHMVANISTDGRGEGPP